MTASSRREIDAHSRLRFSGPLRVSLIVVAAMALVALAFILVPQFGGGPGPGASVEVTPRTSVSATTTPMPTAAPTPTPTAAPTPKPEPTPEAVAHWIGLSWSEPVTPSFTVHLADLLPWEDGYVAVGSVEVDANRSEAAFLTSPDGLHWTVAYQVDPGVDRFPRHVVTLDGRLFAFSHPNTAGLGLPGASEPLVWTSADGVAWSAVDSQSWRDAWAGLWIGPMPFGWDETQYDIPTGLVDVAAGPRGMVAIGNSFADDVLVPVVRHSADGITWSTVNLPAGSSSALLDAVAATADGFVIVGAVDAGPRIDPATPAAWFSADGVIWTSAPVAIDGAVFPDGVTSIGEMGDVTVGADGMVGWWGGREMTAGGPRFLAAWTSADGRTWEPRDMNVSIPSLGYRYVAGDGMHIVALGPAPSLAMDPSQWPGLTDAWESTDGMDWSIPEMTGTVQDQVEGMWVVPGGVIYAGVRSFWFGSAVMVP